MPSKDGKIRVLAISGGGIRGMLPARILQHIEESTGKRICELFDVVAGTSTGSILAAALTKPEPLSARDCVNLYLRRGKDIFSSSWWHKTKTLNGNVGPKYDGIGLRSALTDAFGAAVLEQATVPTFAVGYAIERRSPIFFKSWVPTTPAQNLVDVCMASSAGPTYFPPASVNGVWYCDGGVVNNNPALSGVIEACMKYGCHTRDCLVLSLGTGLSQESIDHNKAMGWGNLQWVQPLIGVFMDGVTDLTHYQLCDLLPNDNYLYLNCAIPADMAHLDGVSPENQAFLLQAADRLLDSTSGQLLTLTDRL